MDSRCSATRPDVAWPIEQFDLALRNETYRLFVDLGRAPDATEVAAVIGVAEDEVRSSWRRLHEAHALVLNDAGAEIRMANPFSAVPTAYRVEVDGRSWFANCAWDAVGVCAALRSDGRITTACADCGEPIVLDIHDRIPGDPDLLFHCQVAAAHWWDDIVHT